MSTNTRILSWFLFTFSFALATATQANAQVYTFTPLYGLGGASDTNYAGVSGINNSGQIVGTETSSDLSIIESVTWQLGNSTATPLTLLSGASYSQVTSINDAGVAAGISSFDDGTSVATIWNGLTPTALASPSGAVSTEARAINNAGQVWGTSYTSILPRQGTKSGVLWSANGVPSVSSSNVEDCSLFASACGRNVSLGEYVGGNSNGHAAIFSLTDPNVDIDLNSLVDPAVHAAGWTLGYAVAINDKGWIIGGASNAITGQSTSFLLTPSVPEPSTLTTLMVGLGMGYVARRRKPTN